MGGAHYMFVIVDDFTRKLFVYLHKEKNQALNFFKEFVRHVENETDLTVKCLRIRTYNGTEFLLIKILNNLRRRRPEIKSMFFAKGNIRPQTSKSIMERKRK